MTNTKETEQSTGFRQRLTRRDQLVGVIVKIPNPSLVEICGHLGFDVVVIDTEHGAPDVVEVEHHIRAAEAAGISTLVRVGQNHAPTVLTMLDAGATGIIVPHVGTADEAAHAVAAAHYPPSGVRGLALTTRAGLHTTRSLVDHLAAALAETVVVVQIEDQSGVDAAGEIAAVPGVDGVWIGPNDLALSLGHPHDQDHPRVRSSIRAVAQATGESPAALCALSASVHQAGDWRELGASLHLFTAHGLFISSAREILAGVT